MEAAILYGLRGAPFKIVELLCVGMFCDERYLSMVAVGRNGSKRAKGIVESGMFWAIHLR